MSQQKECVVGLKKVLLSSRHAYGYVLDELKPCCNDFGHWFHGTGNRKITSVNFVQGDDRNGFNLVTRGNKKVVVLRSLDPSKESRINFCPFCGAEVIVKITRVVELRRREKTIFDGYDEVELAKETVQQA